MFFSLFVAGLAAGAVNAVVLPRQNNGTSNSTASLPQYDSDPSARAAAISVKQAGYLYGPSLMGDAAPFPTGSLGDAMWRRDFQALAALHTPLSGLVVADHQVATAALNASGGLNSVEDYATKLYDGQWLKSIPGGPYEGTLTNYTQDLYFSMERLSSNPYALKRLLPSTPLPFAVDDDIAIKLTGRTLFSLQESGHLFVADHSSQAKYATVAGRYGPAATAYFFIHPESGDFLPLAIATNVGSNLIYTPLDSANDWLLAKIAFNVNDVFFAQMFHLVASHDVGEAVHQAALRTLSDKHPILKVLNRLMYQAYGVRVAGAQTVTNPGGNLDMVFYNSGVGALPFVADYWRSSASAYRANYLATDLTTRGLLADAALPQLKSFPFYTDASAILAVQTTFFTTFVNTYYPNAADITADTELAAWLTEASSLVQDFPTTVTATDLVDLLAHFAYLTGVAHHALNTGNSVSVLGTLPFHPTALYAPLPTHKNISSVLPFLPPAAQALTQIDVFARFNMPGLREELTVAGAYSDAGLLTSLKPEVGVAAEVYRDEMRAISENVRARAFGADGLSEGMPVLFKNLDPGTMPFFFAI